MWNEQHDSILQKEFGFYFSLDNAPYPNVWINSATAISRAASPQRKSPTSGSREKRGIPVMCSRDLWTTSPF